MRRSQMNKRVVFILLLFCVVLQASAQKKFGYKASVNKIDSTGFYKIILDPALLARSEVNQADIRLRDQSGNFVPYITDRDLPKVEKWQLLTFPKITLKNEKDTGTTFIVQNNAAKPISTLWVKLANTAVYRTINLYGADDLNHWFAIRENIPLQQADGDNDQAKQRHRDPPDQPAAG